MSTCESCESEDERGRRPREEDEKIWRKKGRKQRPFIQCRGGCRETKAEFGRIVTNGKLEGAWECELGFVAVCCCIHDLNLFVCFLFRFQRTIRLPEHNKDNHNNNNRQKGRGSERCQIEPKNGHGAGKGVRRKGGRGEFDIFQAQEAMRILNGATGMTKEIIAAVGLDERRNTGIL